MKAEHPQVAFGKDGRVGQWCEVTTRLAGGDFDFHVINGLWNGRYVASTGKLLVNATGQWYDAQIVWRGNAAFSGSEYGEAIDWIERQIRMGALGRWCDRALTRLKKAWANRHLRPKIVWVDPSKEEMDEIPF